MLRINEEAPNFKINTTHGEIDFHNWIGEGWAILFSHPKDFTPVCTTELGTLAKMADEFKSRNCKIIGLSVDSIEDHNAWRNDIEEVAGATLSYPLIADENLEVAKLYNMLPIKVEGNSSKRTAIDNLTVRSVFLIGPDKRIKMNLTYPMSSGRDFFEILRRRSQIIRFRSRILRFELYCENQLRKFIVFLFSEGIFNFEITFFIKNFFLFSFSNSFQTTPVIFDFPNGIKT